MRLPFLIALTTAWALAQTQAVYENRPARLISNGKLELLILPRGAAIGSVVLTDDADKLNPLWNPVRHARELGEKGETGSILGHFLCLDAFGPVSPEEEKAGLKFHGEAVLQEFETQLHKVTQLVLTTTLPIVQEKLTRTFELVPGENIVYVHSKLESQVGFDRPIAWAEHATIGSPFLERASTVFDVPAVRSKTRPYALGPGSASHRLASNKDFEWPNVPLSNATTTNLRAVPKSGASGDHTTHLLDPQKPYGWVTAIHPGKKLIIGWIFKTADFPWLQNWESFPTNDKLARGLEFSTQPFDVPRREAVAMNGLFGAPTFRWLPAKAAIETDFAIFYAHTPAGFDNVKDVRIVKGSVLVEDASGKQLTLSASHMF